MKLKTFARRAAAAGAVLAALMLAALPALAAPKVQVNTTNAVADHADILSDETEQYVNDVSIKLSDACGAQIGVYTLDELLGSTTMEGFAYDVFNAWGLGSDDLDNGVLLLLAPNEADGGDYYIMRGDGLESQLSFSTLGSLLDEYMEPYWVNGDYDTGTQKTVQALANRLCSIYGVTLNSSYTDTSAPDKGGPNVMRFVLLVVAVLLVIWLITYLMRPRGPRPPRGGGGGSSKPTVDIPDDVPTGLNGDDHFAYIVGYPNGNVEPNGNITRAEVATIFFRLLTEEVRTANSTQSNSLSDVTRGQWFNHAVSTLSSMGIVKGHNDGTFAPNAPITRAEFAAIAARFDDKNTDMSSKFTDIASHWAKNEIGIAANKGWINGYPDGTFRPNQYITRAEAMTLVNRVLNRLPENSSDLLDSMIKWPDNSDASAWYYLAVQEATNSHAYSDKSKDDKYEKWTTIRDARDWTELEK